MPGLRHSGSRFKGKPPGNGNKNGIKGNRPKSPVLPLDRTSGVFQLAPKPSSKWKHGENRQHRQKKRNGNQYHRYNYHGHHNPAYANNYETKLGYHDRRRDSRVNGSDLYVARVTKGGLGCAKPCWRCLEWCRWAGIKRVFHFSSNGTLEVIKVSEARPEDMYSTAYDVRTL